MKGRMRPYLPELTIRDYNTYQWYQRGVRRQLYTTYGLYSCYGLRYNGVLFAVLADSLAGRPATCKRMREPGTLVWRQMMCQTQGIRLAAQVEVLLSWHRIQDAQWADLPFYKKVRRPEPPSIVKRTDSHVGPLGLLGMTKDQDCHCEERSDVAIRIPRPQGSLV